MASRKAVKSAAKSAAVKNVAAKPQTTKPTARQKAAAAKAKAKLGRNKALRAAAVATVRAIARPHKNLTPDQIQNHIEDAMYAQTDRNGAKHDFKDAHVQKATNALLKHGTALNGKTITFNNAAKQPASARRDAAKSALSWAKSNPVTA